MGFPGRYEYGDECGNCNSGSGRGLAVSWYIAECLNDRYARGSCHRRNTCLDLLKI